MSERIWTDAQKRAFTGNGRSLLVSAAAGSGKTSVLAERCARLVSQGKNPCDVDELLVVTFTEESAATMRARIQTALLENQDRSTRMARQLALVEHAQISTIHGFCNRLLREHFSAAGVDPQFRVLAADEAALLRRETARELFDDAYERDASGQFQNFIDAYGNGGDEQLMELVIDGYEMVCSLEHPRKWIAAARDRLIESASKPLDQSELGRTHLEAVKTALRDLKGGCASALAGLKALGGFAGYVMQIKEWEALVDAWSDALERRGYDELIGQFKRFEPENAPRISNATPNKEQAKPIFDSIKDQLCNGELAELLKFTQAELCRGQANIIAPAGVFLNLIQEFAIRYTKAKAHLRGLDFSDLERKALKLLCDSETGAGPSEVARLCHQQFKHVCVDEYQDVNEIQDAILKLVSMECIADETGFDAKPNLFAVGDVKQSIYRFRLAEPKLFLDRMSRFRLANDIGDVIDLQENFRSRPPLLEAINNVFARLMTKDAAEIDYSDGHRLNPSPTPKFPNEGLSGAPIELHILPQVRDADDDVEVERSEYEAMLCAQRIRKLYDDKTPIFDDGGFRPVRYSDIVLLLRSPRKKAEDFAKVLRRHKIPVHYDGGSGFFEATEVRDVLALLSVLDNQRQDVPLAAVLRSPIARLSDAAAAMANVRLAYPDPVAFFEAVVRYAKEQTNDLATELSRILTQLAKWRELASQKPLADVLWHIYDTTGYLTFVAGLEGGEQRAANLIHLHQRARDFGSFLEQGLHLFIRFLSQLREEMDLGLPSISGGQENVVRILSIHRAKGQEYPIVIVPDLGKKFNNDSFSGSILMDRHAGLGMKVVEIERRIRYASMSWTLTQSTLHRQALAEEMRLLYVAMTRAKEKLILIGTAAKKASDQWKVQWPGHVGALPGRTILSATNALDWLGPVAVACGNKTLDTKEYDAAEMQSWPDALAAKEAKQPVARELMELRPISPPPEMTDEARRVLSRFEFVYPHQSFTRLPAATSPTKLKPPKSGPAANVENELELPAFLSSKQPVMSGTEIGTATHLLLQHFDFSRPCDAADIEAQLAELVKRRVMMPQQASAVDQPSIAWMMQTELGGMLRKNAGRLRRELAFGAALPGESADPMDAVMLRGKIDLIIPTEAGIAVVDYKTDRISAEQVGRRAEDYSGQVAAYRDALSRVAGQNVTAVYLVFLHPRIVWTEA